MATKLINSKQWQDNSDGWVKTMHESRIKKEVIKRDECDHPIEEWCEVCQYDENGAKYEF